MEPLDPWIYRPTPNPPSFDPSRTSLEPYSTRSHSVGGSHAVFSAGQAVTHLGVIATGYHAYKNQYARTGDRIDAVWQALLTARRWYVWFIACWWMLAWAVWWWWLYTLDSDPHFHDYITSSHGGTWTHHFDHQYLIGFPVMFLWMGVLYCRNIDSGLFKRRLLYRIFNPFYRLMEWCPSFFMYVWMPVWCFVDLPIPM